MCVGRGGAEGEPTVYVWGVLRGNCCMYIYVCVGRGSAEEEPTVCMCAGRESTEDEPN